MPGQLLELHVENFRSLRDVTIPLASRFHEAGRPTGGQVSEKCL